MKRDWIKDCITMCNGTRDYSYKGMKVFVSNSETVFVSGNHSHEEYEFMFVKSKNILTLCNGNDISLEKGQFMPFNSLDIHGQRNPVSVKGFMCIIIDADLIKKVASTAFDFSGNPLFKNKCFLPSSNLNYYLGTFIDEHGVENNVNSYTISLLLKLIIIELFKCSENNVKSYEVKGNNSISRGKKVLDENYKSNFNLKELADAAGMNKFYFLKIFKKEMGMSPKQYYLKLKIEKAKSMITLGEMILTDIAYELGYSSQSHFCMHFKQQTGITPREYQRSLLI